MTRHHDLIVIGAGPAGAAAATEAAMLGLDTLIIDEAPKAGGQVYRAPAAGIVRPRIDKDARAGLALRARLEASGATCAFSQRVWFIEGGYRVLSIGEDGPLEATSDALILATGALERNIPIPGWTLPGVCGLAAATILLKSEAILPGRRVVVAGSGPLLALVAANIVKGGGVVAAVVDATPRSAWLGHVLGLLSRPDLMAKGAVWIAGLVKSGVPILSGHALSSIEGRDAVERVRVVPLASNGALVAAEPRVFECDAVCYGFGLMPSTEATRLLGADHAFDRASGGWSVRTDVDQRTSKPKLYAAGDGAGVYGAAAAPIRGRLAALAAARDLGRVGEAWWQEQASPLRRRLKRAAAFGGGMSKLAVPGDAAIGLTTPDTIVCRCEGVTRASLDKAIADGSVTMNDLKATTRCGMGPCGGRVCADAASAIIAAATGRPRSTIAEATARPPLRPIPLDRVAAGLSYDDLPIPAPAPL